MPERNKEAELAMMNQPLRWPRWPMLPVKKLNDPKRRPGSFPLLGVLVAMDNPTPAVVYDLNPFQPLPLDNDGQPKGNVLERHDSLEALYDAGWVVD